MGTTTKGTPITITITTTYNHNKQPGNRNETNNYPRNKIGDRKLSGHMCWHKLGKDICWKLPKCKRYATYSSWTGVRKGARTLQGQVSKARNQLNDVSSCSEVEVRIDLIQAHHLVVRISIRHSPWGAPVLFVNEEGRFDENVVLSKGTKQVDYKELFPSSQEIDDLFDQLQADTRNLRTSSGKPEIWWKGKKLAMDVITKFLKAADTKPKEETWQKIYVNEIVSEEMVVCRCQSFRTVDGSKSTYNLWQALQGSIGYKVDISTALPPSDRRSDGARYYSDAREDML
ncbi:hypothetical protein Tco_0199158 [Tanacetum coccineum]